MEKGEREGRGGEGRVDKYLGGYIQRKMMGSDGRREDSK